MRIERPKAALLLVLIVVLMIPIFLTAPATPVQAIGFLAARSGYLQSTCTLWVPDSSQIVVTGGPNAFNYNNINDKGPVNPDHWYNPGDLPPVEAAAKVGAGRIVARGCARDFAGTEAASNGTDQHLFNIYDWLDPLEQKTILWYNGKGLYYTSSTCSNWIGRLQTEKGYTVTASAQDPITAELLAPYSIFQISNIEGNAPDYDTPDRSFTADERTAIVDWVNAGGGLFLMCQEDYKNYGQPAWNNPLLAALGVSFRFQDDAMQDPVDYGGTGSGFPAPYGPISYLTDHEINNTPGVNVRISTNYQETWPGGKPAYTVTVKNPALTPDNYILTVSDTAEWNPTLSSNILLNVDGGEERQVKLTVTIRSDAAIGAEDVITVTATSLIHAGVSDTKNCTAHAAKRIMPPIDDTYTHAERPNIAFGTGSSVYTGWYDHTGTPGTPSPNGGAERTWMKFDLSTLPADATIGRVLLWLYCYTVPSGGGHVEVHSVDNKDWSEKDVTWNNSPGGVGGVLGPVIAGPNELTEADKYYSWDVTSYVQEQRTVDNIVSLCLIDISENLGAASSSSFDAKEFENIPMWPYLEFVSSYRVDVSISPGLQDTSPGRTLTYTVTVTNTGSLSDSYSLAVSDNAGWSPSLSSTSLTNVGADENRTVTLTVTIPSNAPILTKDNITVTATGTGVSASASCVAQAFVGFKLQPIADTDVTSGYPGANHGDNISMYIQSSSITPGYKNENIYLKFDLSGIQAGTTISSAEIWLWCYDAKYADINAQCRKVTDDSWLEHGITWGSAVGLPGDLISATPLKVGVTGWYSWSVTPFVVQQRGVDNIASFCIGAEVPDADGRYIFDSKEYSDNTKRPQLRIAFVTAPPENIRGVEVSISPPENSAENGQNVTFTVTVTNTGIGYTDSYTLENTDNAGWSKSLPSSVGPLAPGASANVTLSITIPADAENCTRDSITITATCQENTVVESSDTCVAHCLIGAAPPPPENAGVQVTISENSKSGAPGEVLTFTVTVTNTGASTDTFALTASENWGPTLSIPSTTLAAGASRQNIKLSITIPSTAADGDSTTITVTATGTGYENSATCTATAQTGGGTSPFVYVGAVVVIVGIIAAVITVIRIKPF